MKKRFALMMSGLILAAVMLALAFAPGAALAAAKPTWSGPTKMPVHSEGVYKVTNGSIRVKSGNGRIVELDREGRGYYSIEAERKGTATLALLDSNGREVATRTVQVYGFSGEYVFESAMNPNYVLDIRGKSKANSAQIILWTRTGARNQRFRIQAVYERDGDFEGYQIIAVHSGKALDVKGGGRRGGAQIIQYTKKSANSRTIDNQLFEIKVDAKNRVTFESEATDLAMDVRGGRAVKGSNLILYRFTGNNNQKWWLKRA